MKMKGALVEITGSLGVPVPNVVLFQFNPETVRHSWTQPLAASSSNPLAVRGEPGETYSFSLAMDATDDIDPIPPAPLPPPPLRLPPKLGLHVRLAALEQLMFPIQPKSGDNPLPAPPTWLPSGGAGRRAVPASLLPVVLFVWGELRIVPVRVTSLSITEKLFDDQLNPTHADAQIELRVLTGDDLRRAKGLLVGAARDIYETARHLREALALRNVAGEGAKLITSMLKGPL